MIIQLFGIQSSTILQTNERKLIKTATVVPGAPL